MGGGFESKPGGSSLLQPTVGTRGGDIPGPGKRTLTGQLGGSPANGATASHAVQRKAADGSNESAPPSPAKLRRVMELYLGANQIHVWNVVGDHARSVYFPDPHPRLTWVDQRAFVRELVMQLEANIADFTPLAKLDEILFPSDATRTVGPMLPSTDAWSPPLGLAIAQVLQIAIVSSLYRLGPRYLAVADSRGAAGDGGMNPGALIYSMPIDRYVGAAMCAPRVLTIEPPDAKAAAKPQGKPTGLRATKLAWEGARDPHLWNWVRAIEPSDATAEEVAATLWTVTDHHGETNAAFNAYLLAAAPPLFGIPKKFAIKNPNARQYASAHALAGEDSVSAELMDIAKSSAGDDIALHQSPAGPSPGKAAPAAPAPELGPLLAMVGDCNLQLGFVTTEVATWGLTDHVAPALAFVTRKSNELVTADAKALTDWNRVISGQRDRLFKVSGAIHNLASTTKKLGVKDAKAPEATPVREILELLATAAGTSHLAQTSDARLQQALELQSGLNARAMQATERDLGGAHLDFRATMGGKGANSAGAYSHEVADLQDRSRRLQTTMINGGKVDTAEVDEVTLRSGEIALRERVLGTIHSTFELQEAAMSAKEGLAAHIAMLLSGKFRNLETLCQHIRDRVVPIQSEMIATEQRIHDEEQNQAGTPVQKAKHRATRRAVLAKAQAEFAKISADEDLQHFFREGAKVVQNQQFRTACVKVAALIGIAVLAAATGGAATELAGGMLMEAGGVATVAELSTVARIGITTANLVTDSAVNAVGQAAIQGGSLKEAFVENLFMSFASTALFGTIARASAETARLEGREATTWAKADTFAQKAFVAGREVGAITVHTVWGAAIGYVAHRAVDGHEPSPMEARDWMLQGASVAIGRGVHKALGARMPGLERLAKRSAEARRLVLEAQQLQQLASTVEHSKDAASAVELLDQRTKLLREEIEAIEHIVAKAGDASGELGKMRLDLEHQIHESSTQAMLETKFHLLGLEELVPGALWKGSDEQVQHALQEARTNGGKVSAQDPHSKRWKLVLDGREVQIQEAPPAKTPANPHERVPVADDSHKAPHERTTQRDMKAVDPNVDPDTGAMGVTFQGRGDRIGALAKKVAPESGYFDLVVHGDGRSFAVLHDGQWVKIKPNSVRQYLRAQKGYHGQPIRLLSCEAGADGATTAQAIADGMNVHVKAPTEKIWFSQDKVTGDIELIIGNDPKKPSGGWAEFGPQGAKARAPADPKAPVDESRLPPHERTTGRFPAQPDPDEHAARPGDVDSHEPVSLAKPLPEMTSAERAKVEAAVDKHIERIRSERIQGATPASEKAVKDAAYAAAEKTYRERRRDGQADAGARKAASDSGKLAADQEWTVQAEKLAVDKVNQAIADGTVFDRSAMSEPAREQLDAYRRGTARDGSAARKYSTALTGKMTLPDMELVLDPEVKAGTAARKHEEIKGPPPSGKQTQIAYYFLDGSVIRLKPHGDEFNDWRPSYSVEVKSAGAPGGSSDPSMIAFKVDQFGRAVPKDPDHIANPYVDGKFLAQRTVYDQHVLNSGHRLAK